MTAASSGTGQVSEAARNRSFLQPCNNLACLRSFQTTTAASSGTGQVSSSQDRPSLQPCTIPSD